MAWANFVDKTADINDYANYIQGSLQGDKPDPHQLSDYWIQNHQNWLQVADGWIPPAPILTKTQQYAAINAEYDTARAKLLTSISYAESIGNESGIVILKAKVASNEVDRKAKILEVANG